MAYCNMCGAQIADGATVCAACSSRPAVVAPRAGAGLADNVAGMLAYFTIIVAHIPFLGFLTVLVWPLIGLGGFIVWIILLLKANQGQMFKLPLLGDLAQQQAG